LNCGVPIPLEAILQVDMDRSIIYASAVEIHDYKDILSIPRRGLNRDLLVQINSDPVTAGLYSVLAAFLITGRAI
jgi:hypothetical protein